MQSQRETVATDRSGVIDIGSNSVRLVIYEGPARAPFSVFNEKILCGLGRRLHATGRLDPDGVADALENLPRFVSIADAMAVRDLAVVATAAVRDAEDGEDFVARVRQRCGIEVAVLSGTEEARLAGLGVIAGFPQADGIVADQGGGSLELVEVDRGRPRRQATLPLGPLGLDEDEEAGADTAAIVQNQLATVSWLAACAGRDLYAVGGAWRALARMHMAQQNYPLRVIDHYSVPASAMLDLARVVAHQKPKSLARIRGIAPRRLPTLPKAALILLHALERSGAARVVFSSRGLREGLVYDSLPSAVRRRDPLIEAARFVAERSARFTGSGEAMYGWMQNLFGDEPPARARLRLAACLLGDIGWFEHPGYRARISYERLLTMPLAGLDHAERLFLAAAAHARYTGEVLRETRKMAGRIGLEEDYLAAAVTCGRAMRLGYAIAAGRPSLLSCTALRLRRKKLTLMLPADNDQFGGSLIRRRRDSLAESLGVRSEVRFATPEEIRKRNRAWLVPEAAE